MNGHNRNVKLLMKGAEGSRNIFSLLNIYGLNFQGIRCAHHVSGNEGDI